jgi:ABC-type transport system involved in multi-copper enzyme maturation permease subunit
MKMRWTSPVLDKEFRTRMRSWRSYLAIVLYLAFIGLVGFVIFSQTDMMGRSMFDGRGAFMVISYVQLGLISFVVPSLSAGVISGEREMQTLNLLLTTPQSSLSIILSKLLSSVAFMLLMIVASLPLYTMIILGGGVSPLELLETFLYLIFLIIVYGAVGIFYSTVLKRTVMSFIMSYVTVAAISGLIPLFAMIFSAIWRTGLSGESLWYAISPIYGMSDLFFDVGGRDHWVLGWNVGMLAVLTGLAIWMSVRSLRSVRR